MVPKDLRYTKDHEWVKVDGDVATIGVTDYAASQLGDVVFVDLPAVGKAVDQFAGEVTEVKAALGAKPELVNSDPFGDGWMIRVKVSDAGQLTDLLDAAGYEQLTSEG